MMTQRGGAGKGPPPAAAAGAPRESGEGLPRGDLALMVPWGDARSSLAGPRTMLGTPAGRRRPSGPGDGDHDTGPQLPFAFRPGPPGAVTRP